MTDDQIVEQQIKPKSTNIRRVRHAMTHTIVVSRQHHYHKQQAEVKIYHLSIRTTHQLLLAQNQTTPTLFLSQL